MNKLDRLKALGYINEDTRSKSDELLDRVKSDFNKKSEELNTRLDLLIQSTL